MLIDPAALLRTHGLYVTPQRLAVLRAVTRRPHATADELVQSVNDDISSVSRQSVYDALHTLTNVGVLRRIQPMGSPARYETRVDDNHHHLICRSCGAVADVDCAVGERPCLDAAEAHGYDIDEAEVIYWGRCPACRDDEHTSPSTSPRSEGRS